MHESSNDQFRGKEYDIRFQRIHRKAFGMDNPTTTDHIRCGHPTLEEIQREFPTSKILGRENCDIWLRYMILARRALIGFFTGIVYLIFWKRRDNKPPYHGCLVTVDIAKT